MVYLALSSGIRFRPKSALLRSRKNQRLLWLMNHFHSHDTIVLWTTAFNHSKYAIKVVRQRLDKKKGMISLFLMFWLHLIDLITLINLKTPSTQYAEKVENHETNDERTSLTYSMMKHILLSIFLISKLYNAGHLKE